MDLHSIVLVVKMDMDMGNQHEGGHDHSGNAGHEYVVYGVFCRK